MRSPTASPPRSAFARRRIRAGFALALVAALGARLSAQHLEIEQRIEQGWRWRQLRTPGPGTQAPSFRSVRPWRDGGLIAVDDGGLAVFDGYEWTRLPCSESLQNREVYDLLPARDGLFAVCDGLLLAIDLEGRATSLGRLPRPSQLTPAFKMPDGSYLVAIADRVLELTTVAAGPRDLSVTLGDANVIHSVAVDADGDMWAVTDAGLFRERAGGWAEQLPSSSDLVRSQRFLRAIRAGDDLYFLPESLDDASQARMWDDSGKELRIVRQAESSVTVVDAATCPDGALVLAQHSPKLQVIREGVGHLVSPGLPSGDKLRSVCFTSGGRMAVVSGAGELWVADLASDRWETYDTAPAGVNQLVNAFAPASAGGLWVGTHLGLARFDGRNFLEAETVAGETGVILRAVTALAEDAQGRLWVGSGSTFRGALCRDAGRWTHLDGPDDVGDRYVHAIQRVGDDLWFLEFDAAGGPFHHGRMVRLRDGVFTRFEAPEGGGHFTRCYDLVERPDGVLLAATFTGVYAFEDEVWRAVSIPELRTDRAFALHLRPDGSLWIGLGLSHEGIIELRDGTARRYEDDDWRRAAAAAFCDTKDGRLWFASENGLFLVSEGDCHEVTAGLPARNFWPMACDGQGGLWLGSMGSGVVRFTPDDRDPPRTLSVEISFTEAGNAIATWEAADKWQSTPPGELRFRFALDGSPIRTVASWMGTRQRHEADLGPLRGGDAYTLRVTAVDMMGNVETAPLEKEFTVPPPTWRSPPMLAALGALALTMLVVALVLANRRRERIASQQRQSELAERLSVLTRRLFSSAEDERRKLSRELHDDLGQSLTSIGLDLQIVERKGTSPEGRVATQRALSTVRAALDRVRAISSLLRPAVLDDLGLEQAVRTALTEFTTRTGVDGQLDIELGVARVPEAAAGHVYRILQEALTNVARHASASTAFVNLVAQPERIELTVRDDGSGFLAAEVPTAKRFGLLGMRERSELMGGSFTLETAPGAGTTIRVSIPLKPAPEPS